MFSTSTFKLYINICSHRVKAARKELPYEFDSLVWDENHTRNDREKFCYCGENGDWYRRMLQCQSCLQWFHQVGFFCDLLLHRNSDAV